MAEMVTAATAMAATAIRATARTAMTAPSVTIRARRVTGVSVQEQRLIANAVKNAREMALLPYSSSGR